MILIHTPSRISCEEKKWVIQKFMNKHFTHADKKVTLHIMIEGGRTYTDQFVIKQKLQVIVNKTLEHFNLTDANKRQLTRGDDTVLNNYSLTIEDVGLRDNETLRIVLKQAPIPDGPKKFAWKKTNHWYEELPEVYNAELETLKHGLAFFKFIELLPFTQTGGQLHCIGELSLSEGRKQVIRIVFPHGYPYTPPEVFPLLAIFSEQGSLQFQNTILQGVIKTTKAFNKGNQYNNDKICLFNDEEVWIPFTHGVGMALKQSINWLETAMSEKGFTKNIVVEENAPIIVPTGQILSFLPDQLPDSNRGTLLLKPFKDNFFSLVKMIFESASSITAVNCFPDNTVLSPSRSEYTSGQWFLIESGNPRIILPQLSNPEGLKIFLAQNLKINLEDILPGPEANAKKVIIGFRFKEVNEIHFFQLFYWKQGALTQFNHNYLLHKNLTGELFARIESLFDIDSLQQKKVLVVGLGALGSETLKELSASCIGNFAIIDAEHFEAGNSVRHAADLMHVGERKAEIVKKIIEGKNPQAKVQVLPVNIFALPQELLIPLIEESDIVLNLTANRLVEEYLNQKVCIERKKPLIQAAASKGGLTGMVIATVPGTTICFECLKQKGLNVLPAPNKDVSDLESTKPDFGACSQPAFPGCGIDTREIALQTARITLQLLSKESAFYPSLLGYQFYWHGPSGSKNHEPFQWEIKNAPFSTSCNYCNCENGSKNNN